MEGYIKAYRRMLEWCWFRDPAVSHLFIYLLLRANYYDADWRGITISRGQLITSRYTLSIETGLKEKVVRRGLKALEKTGEIHVKSTSQYSLITICNFSEYQCDENSIGQQRANIGPAKGQQRASKGPQIKKEKNKINKESSLCSDSSLVSAPTIHKNNIDHKAFMQFFNKEMAGKAIPQLKLMNKLRQGMLNARVREHGKEAVDIVVRKAAASSWLNGGSGKFVANFNWLFKQNNFLKVFEGNYDDNHPFPTSGQPNTLPLQLKTDSTIITPRNTSFNFSSYEDYRKTEQKKRREDYTEAVAEILNRH